LEFTGRVTGGVIAVISAYAVLEGATEGVTAYEIG
jgi:hypothetical protein